MYFLNITNNFILNYFTSLLLYNKLFLNIMVLIKIQKPDMLIPNLKTK
jgi:hypothetical protein